MNTFGTIVAAAYLMAVAAPGVAMGTTMAESSGESPGTAESSLSGPAAAIRDALRRGRPETDAMYQTYEAHDFRPIWDEARTVALVSALGQAERHGLPADRYATEALEASADRAADERELELSRTFLRYARDLNSGLLEPRAADRDIVIEPRRPDPVALLEGMIDTPDPAGYLEALAPTHPDYGALLAEKSRLERLMAAGGWGEPVPDGRILREGDRDSRVTALRARLGRMDGRDLGVSPEYDEELERAVRKFQLRHGLKDDGVAGPKTFEALNAPVRTRLAQVLVNLERQRWLNYDRGSRHVYVNLADFSVQLIDDDETTLWSRVVVGTNRHRTQEFNDEMTHLVVNPTWHVPRSIATEEMLPQLKRNPGALGGSMQIMTRNGIRVNPQLVDFTQFTKANFPFLVKQEPGGGNALGRVKFMFPNQFNIYLHDTPSKNLFNKDVRAFSHGCVRVQKPFELAHLLLAPQRDDPAGYFRSLLDGGRERRVNLEAPVPVYLTYQSVWIDESGVPQYRHDVYGRDGRVFEALQRAGVLVGTLEG